MIFTPSWSTPLAGLHPGDSPRAGLHPKLVYTPSWSTPLAGLHPGNSPLPGLHPELVCTQAIHPYLVYTPSWSTPRQFTPTWSTPRAGLHPELVYIQALAAAGTLREGSEGRADWRTGVQSPQPLSTRPWRRDLAATTETKKFIALSRAVTAQWVQHPTEGPRSDTDAGSSPR